MTILKRALLLALLSVWLAMPARAQSVGQEQADSIKTDGTVDTGTTDNRMTQVAGSNAGTSQKILTDAAGNLTTVPAAGAVTDVNVMNTGPTPGTALAVPIDADTGAGTTNYLPVIVRTPGAAGTGLDGVAVRSSTEAITSTGGSLEVGIVAGQDGIAGGTGVTGVNVPRVTLATDVGLPAGTANIGDVDILVGGAAATANTGVVGASTIRVTQATDVAVNTDLDSISGTTLAVPFDLDTGAGVINLQGVSLRFSGAGATTEAGTAATPIRTDPTGATIQPVSDGAGSLTVDAPIGTPVFSRLSDGVDASLITAAGSLQVDGSGVTQPVSGTVTANAGTGNFAVNLAQVAGAAVPTGNGTAAGAQRVAIASDNTAFSVNVGTFPDNEPINTAQMNGVAVTMGNGISGTGVQRVTIASDSTGSVAATQSGTWTTNTSTRTATVGTGSSADTDTPNTLTSVLMSCSAVAACILTLRVVDGACTGGSIVQFKAPLSGSFHANFSEPIAFSALCVDADLDANVSSFVVVTR